MARKDSALRIRVQRALRDQFLEVCRSQDRPAAQVLREFMRSYIDRHAQTEGGLAPGNNNERRRPTYDD